MKNISLSKDILFSHTTAENIYLHFLGISVLPKKNISSPFSQDKNPSFSLYQHNGTLKFKCFSSGYQGDVFRFVGYLKSLDSNDKTQFQAILSFIAQEMNVPLQPDCLSIATSEIKPVAMNDIPKNSNKTIDLEFLQLQLQPQLIVNKPKIGAIATPLSTAKKPTKLKVSTRAFTKLDLAYWNQLGVSQVVLEKYKVHSISESYFEENKIFKTKENTVSFAYEIAGWFKKYTPEQPQFNVKKALLPHLENTIFGLEQLGTAKKQNIIICEGEKDVLVAVSRGFFAVSFGSATILPTQEQIKKLQSLCTNLLVCYDNDDAGANGKEAILQYFPNSIPLQLPQNQYIKGYDIADYFQEHTTNDFQKIIDLALENKKNTVEVNTNTDLTLFHRAENYISKHYDVRFDTIANEIEISKKNENQWEELNENSLYVAMQKKHIKISMGNLKAILASDFVPKFNPLCHYFESLSPWDKKTDYMQQFLDYVELEAGEDREQFVYHFRKWCVRSVKCAIQDNYFNKQAFVLSDDAKGQSIGKTTFIRFLVPPALNKYYCENLPEDKDALKRLGQNFIINLDELATLSRTDINKLKSMFSSDKIKTRLPYGAKDIIISRVANFIGSTNMSTFLVDESGSVRWLCFIVKKIDFRYSKAFPIDRLWAQAFALSQDKNFKEYMSPEDIAKNEIRNDKFQIVSSERELIPKYFDVPTQNEQGTHLTATEILNHIALWTSGLRLTVGAIGKAMPKCGFIRKKHKENYGYWVILKPTA